jgi:hypothetical protein
VINRRVLLAPALPIDQGEKNEADVKKLLPTLDIGSHINAAPQPLPKAGAERRLEAVGCRRLFGKVLASCEPAHGLPHNVYWITSSARIRRDGGIVIPRALAVLRLMINSNFVGCSTGRSAGLAPLRILST